MLAGLSVQVKTIAGSSPSYFHFGTSPAHPGYAAPAVVTAAPTMAPTPPPLIVLPVSSSPVVTVAAHAFRPAFRHEASSQLVPSDTANRLCGLLGAVPQSDCCFVGPCQRSCMWCYASAPCAQACRVDQLAAV